jgi:hypothetical protein
MAVVLENIDNCYQDKDACEGQAFAWRGECLRDFALDISHTRKIDLLQVQSYSKAGSRRKQKLRRRAKTATRSTITRKRWRDV